MRNVSLLLGAGFSAPMKYPLVNELNKKLLSLKPEDFSIQDDGTFYKLKSGEKDHNWYSGNRFDKMFFCETMQYYKKRFSDFNYERYYDFLFENRRNVNRDRELDELITKFIVDRKIHEVKDAVNLILVALRTLSQAVVCFIRDGDNKQFYEPVHHGKPVEHYHGFFSAVEKLGASYKVDIHSLNHDLLFERYNSSDYLKGELSDGFEELGSPYYGRHLNYMMRLKYFTANFNKKFNLYKLHSSIDYYPFQLQDGSIDSFIKVPPIIGSTELYKEIKNAKGEFEYYNCWYNYKPDFLSGATSKIPRYNEPIFFKKVFDHFEENLRTSEMLFIAGYACGDVKVNDIIYQNFPIGKKPIYITSKNINPEVAAFVKKTGATVIPKYVENIVPSDIGL